MKKITLALLLALVMVSPTFARAEVVTQVELTPESRAVLLAELNTQLIDLLRQMIKELQLEIAQQLALNQDSINTISTKVDTIVTNTTPTASNSGGNISTPVVPPAPSVTIDAGLNTHSLTVGQHVSFLPIITGAGDFPTLHLTTDSPDGFMRFNGATGGASATTSDQTFAISANQQSGDIIAFLNTPGTFSFTFEVNGTTKVETVTAN